MKELWCVSKSIVELVRTRVYDGISGEGMPGKLLKKLRSIPLHVSILSIFVVLVTVLVGIVVSYNYKNNSEAAIIAADRFLAEIGTSVFERTTRVYEPAFASADLAVVLPEVSLLPDVNGHPMLPVIIDTLDANAGIVSMYMGYATGDFFMVTRLSAIDARAMADRGAPPTARYNVQRVTSRRDGRRVRIMKFLDADLRPVGSRVVKNVGYDPRLRPWYIEAIQAESSVLTEPYVYSFSREVGVTVARRFDGVSEGVFGVDIALSGVSRFLRGQQVGEDSHIFMFGRDGLLLAYSRIEQTVKEVVENGHVQLEAASIPEMGDPAMKAFCKAFEAHGRTSFSGRFEAGGTQYLARAFMVPSRYGKDQFLGIVVPQIEFIGPIVASGRVSLLVSLGALAAFVPIIVFISRRLSRPIRELAEEANRVRRFELEDSEPVRSRISEIRHLALAMATMKSTLASFSQYVPKALVERMVKLDMVPQLGGERRTLTLMFSDIADFTTISETMPAEDLTRMVSRYFNALGSVVLDQGGTIDKFIGDAIMAFWNAPEPEPDHAALACLAALRCRQASLELNRLLEERGKPALHTRIGLHTGEAIVGNVGSPDRMDYTAMGMPVNIASRLEGLNKHYGTHILASLTVVEQAGDDFLFRTVGRVVPKGAGAPLTIFELRGVRGEAARVHPELAVSPEEEACCARWESACGLYLKRSFEAAAQAFEDILADHGEDALGKAFLQRARAHEAEPPGPDWDGVEVFKVK